MAGMRYVSCMIDTDAIEYMHPETRARVKCLFASAHFLPGLRATPANELRSFEDSWAAFVKKAAAKLRSAEPLELAAFLLPLSDAQVVSTVNNWPEPSLPKDDADWHQLHDQAFRDLDSSITGAPNPVQVDIFCASLQHSTSRLMFRKQGPRSQQLWIYQTLKVFGFGSKDWADKHPKDTEFTVDISQNLPRSHVSVGVAGCFTGTSRTLLLHNQRILLGCECLAIQGMTSSFAPPMADTTLSTLQWSLAGNSYAAGSAMCALFVLFQSHSIPAPEPRRRLKRKRPVDAISV